MSALSMSQSYTATSPNLTVSFLATGGTSPYTYSVRSNGAGGMINSSTGLYTAPAVVSPDPLKLYDTIDVFDSVGANVSAQILVGTALLLFCEVLQNQLDLAPGRVYLWDQKITEPNDFDLFIAVAVLTCKTFANTNEFVSSNGVGTSIQSVNMYAGLQIDIMSRGPAARDRKEEVILALNSNYAQSQQEANSFFIGKLPAGSQFLNLSNPDGAAIPYRYNISVALQYFVTKSTAVPYYDTFSGPPLTIQP